MKKKAVFLDRDGIINEIVYHDDKKPSSPWSIEEFKLITGITKPLEELSKLGFLLFVISNQPDISRGNIKKETMEQINRIISGKFPIKEIVVCPHDDYHNCSCRKPKSGMILTLAEKYNIDLKKSWIIGDSWKDIEAGKKVGCKTIILDKSYNKSVNADYRLESLDSTIEVIKYKK